MSTDDASTIHPEGHPRDVRIHIDERPYQSPNPTTGDALYRLGKIKAGLKLYREVKGDHEDPAIEDGPDVIHLKVDEHFHSGEPKGVTIIVEGTPHEWEKPLISYVEVVTLFDPTYPQHLDTIYSVKYSHGPNSNREGILAPGGGPVKVKEGMRFSVSRTGQS